MNVQSRQQKAKLNIYVSLAYQVVSAVCGLIVPKLLLSKYGSEAYGATTSILQFLGYIVLLEGGIGGVARAVLYKPLAENDNEKVSQAIFEIKRFFRIIAYIFAAYVLILACIFKKISHIEVMDWLSTFLLVVVISISTFAQYFVGISNSILLQADQKSYIGNALSSLTLIVNAILVAILTSIGANLVTVKLVSSCVYAVKPIMLWIYVKHNYWLSNIKSNTNILKDKWTGLGQHMAFFFHSHTDVIVLTFFADLKYVAVYSVYNMVTAQIQALSSSFVSGMESVFGNMYALKEKSLLNKTFNLYETMISFFSDILFSVTAVMIVPFVKVYTSNISDTNYIEPLFGVMLTVAAFISCLSSPYSSSVIAAGHFRQTRWAAYGEALVNVLLYILLVKKYGLIGVAIGTVAATLYKLVFYVVYLKKNILNRKISCFLKREFINLSTVALIFVIGKYTLTFLDISNYAQWALAAVVITVLACLITIGSNFLFYRNDCIALLRKAMHRG